MTEYWKHEEDIRNSILDHLNLPKNEKQEKKRLSSTYFHDLKEKLLIEYDNKSLMDVMNCRVCSTSFGDALKITNKEKIDFDLADNKFRSQINHNLKLLPRVGLKTEENLKNKGYSTIESLRGHDKYCDAASKFLDEIDDMSFAEIFELLDNNRKGN